LNILDGSHNYDKYRENTVFCEPVPREYRHMAGVLENQAARRESRSL
jgi:hypothetical protein